MPRGWKMAELQKIHLCFSVVKFWLRYCPKEFGWTCVRYICTHFLRVYSSVAHSPLHCRAALTGRRGLTQITGFCVFATVWFGELGARLIRRRNAVTGYASWSFDDHFTVVELGICNSRRRISALFEDAVYWQLVTKTRRRSLYWNEKRR